MLTLIQVCVFLFQMLSNYLYKSSAHAHKQNMPMCPLIGAVCMFVSRRIYICTLLPAHFNLPFNKNWNAKYHSIVICMCEYVCVRVYIYSYNYPWLTGYATKYPNSHEFKTYMYGDLSTSGEFKVHMMQNSAIKQNIQSSYVTKLSWWAEYSKFICYKVLLWSRQFKGHMWQVLRMNPITLMNFIKL